MARKSSSRSSSFLMRSLTRTWMRPSMRWVTVWTTAGTATLEMMSVKYLPLSLNSMLIVPPLTMNLAGDLKNLPRDLIQHQRGGIVWHFLQNGHVLVVGKRKIPAHIGHGSLDLQTDDALGVALAQALQADCAVHQHVDAL